jgi:hypothetical protein
LAVTHDSRTPGTPHVAGSLRVLRDLRALRDSTYAARHVKR